MEAIRNTGKRLLTTLEDIGLLIVAVATVFAFGTAVLEMVRSAQVTLADLLLLFIYLEVLTMAVAYLESGKLPVRIPIYIAIVALARYLILDMKGMDGWMVLSVAGAMLLLAFAVLIIRFGHCRFPYHCVDRE